jgi:hypothetical protein
VLDKTNGKEVGSKKVVVVHWANSRPLPPPKGKLMPNANTILILNPSPKEKDFEPSPWERAEWGGCFALVSPLGAACIFKFGIKPRIN